MISPFSIGNVSTWPWYPTYICEFLASSSPISITGFFVGVNPQQANLPVKLTSAALCLSPRSILRKLLVTLSHPTTALASAPPPSANHSLTPPCPLPLSSSSTPTTLFPNDTVSSGTNATSPSKTPLGGYHSAPPPHTQF